MTQISVPKKRHNIIAVGKLSPPLEYLYNQLQEDHGNLSIQWSHIPDDEGGNESLPFFGQDTQFDYFWIFINTSDFQKPRVKYLVEEAFSDVTLFVECYLDGQNQDINDTANLVEAWLDSPGTRRALFSQYGADNSNLLQKIFAFSGIDNAFPDHSIEETRTMDPLYPEAFKLGLEINNLSISYIQRNLHVGYKRAEKLFAAVSSAPSNVSQVSTRTEMQKKSTQPR